MNRPEEIQSENYFFPGFVQRFHFCLRNVDKISGSLFHLEISLQKKRKNNIKRCSIKKTIDKTAKIYVNMLNINCSLSVFSKYLSN